MTVKFTVYDKKLMNTKVQRFSSIFFYIFFCIFGIILMRVWIYINISFILETCILFLAWHSSIWCIFLCGREQVIGSYELDVTSIYFSYQHEMYRVWMTLTDPTDEREGTMGFLQVNVCALGPEDEAPVHDISTEKSSVNRTAETTLMFNIFLLFPLRTLRVRERRSFPPK